MKNISILFVLFCMIGIFNSCKKKYDLPPPQNPPAVSGYITIDSIQKRYLKYYQGSVPLPTKLYKFTSDLNLECTVTADEVSGNIYKTVYVEDSTGSLQVKLMASGGLFVGDRIRINLNGVVLDDYAKMVQLDSVDITKRVVKLSSGNIVTPTKMTMNQVLTMGGSGLLKYQGKLVTLDSVEFDPGSKCKTFADPVGKYAMDRYIVGPNGTSLDIRTSGYAKFAGNVIPGGKGSVTAIVTQYLTSPQLTIRDYNEVHVGYGVCPMILKDFDDQDINSGGWSTYNVLGNINWTPGNKGGQLYANISNFVSGNISCETWLISPGFDIAAAPSPYFSFSSAYNYTGPAIQVMVSTNYVSGNPTASGVTWTPVTAVLSPGGWAWTNSGKISLGPHKSPNTHIAFKYTGTSTSGSTWEIDNISVFSEMVP